MTRFTPLWQQGGSYAAGVDRSLLATLFPAPGASGASAAAVANTMNVSIPPGRATVALQAGQNSALCVWDAAEVVTSPTAPASGNSRIDVVVLQVRDPQLDAGVNNDFLFQVLAGAPTTGTPVAPTVPANAAAICQYVVPAAVANLNGVTITDRRVATGPPPVFPTLAALNAAIPNPVRGQLAFCGDTDQLYSAIRGGGGVPQFVPMPLVFGASTTGTTDAFGSYGLILPWPGTKWTACAVVGAQTSFPAWFIMNTTDGTPGGAACIVNCRHPDGSAWANATVGFSYVMLYTH